MSGEAVRINSLNASLSSTAAFDVASQHAERGAVRRDQPGPTAGKSP